MPQVSALLDDTQDIKEITGLIRLADAVPGDEHKICALLAELGAFYGGAPQGPAGQRAAQVAAVLFEEKLVRALLAWDGDSLAGLAAYSFLWPAAGVTTSLYLKELYVAESHRRTGTGKLLMQALHAIAADRGCSRVEWTTDTDNAGAQAFYDSFGVKPLPTKIFYRSALPNDGSAQPGDA